ncbi:MAG: MarR family winged helix-turn-helix transcriptional regulator, partial [bacterium]
MKKYCELKHVFKEIYFLEALLQREVGMSINQIMVLCSLSEKSASISELAKELWVSLPRMSKIATDLEKQGYIKRVQDKNDLRR